MRASPRPNGTAPRLNDGEEYELERFPFETFVDGMRRRVSDRAIQNRTERTSAMELAEIFPSRFLKASDLQGKEHRVKIESAKPERLGDQTKLILTFVNRTKQMVCNKTNSNTIAEALGSNTDNWIGGEIILFAATVSGPNGLVQGIRCRAVPRAAPQPRPEAAPAQPRGQDVDFNDSVPF
jgi:hypothetical protein